MGKSIERLYELNGDTVALAFARVKSYKRTTKTGKVVDVEAHTRSVSKMSFKELQEEHKRLAGAQDPQSKNRVAQIISALRDRHGANPGESFDSSKTQALHRKRLAQGESDARERLLNSEPSQKSHKKRIEAARKDGDNRPWYEIWAKELGEDVERVKKALKI